MDSDEPQQPAVGETAGQQLKQAREKRGLSQKDVADAQHLRVSIIQAIEEGQYDQIDSELFLKGYVRAYAKQVGADADALIESLDLELEPLRRERAKQEQENPLVDIERRRIKKRRVAKTLGILIIVAGIAFAVWKLVIEPRTATAPSVGQEQSEAGQIDEEPGNEPTGNEPTDNSEAVDNIENASVAEDNPEPEAAVATEQAETEAEPVQDAEVDGTAELADDERAGSMDNPVVSVSDYPAPGEGAADNGSVVADEAEAGPENLPVPEPVVNIEPAVQPDPVFEESAQPDSVAASTELEMSFGSDCWVQVTDSSGARLVASLQRDGDRVSVSGRAPFEVVIGAVDAVESVTFGGEPVDLSDFRVVNNRTEFTLTL